MMGMSEPSGVGPRLAQARREANLTQEDIGRLLNVAPETVSRWEQERNVPSFLQVSRLADAYAVSLDWIAGRAPHPSGLRPGHTVVDRKALTRLREAKAHGLALKDVGDLLRPPHVAVAWDVPEDPVVMNSTAEKDLHVEIQGLLQALERS